VPSSIVPSPASSLPPVTLPPLRPCTHLLGELEVPFPFFPIVFVY
jgi:hypothetical protein